MEPTDADLARRISAAAADAAGAEAELCRRFAPRIRLYGLRHLRDEAAAADLVQDVLVTVLESVRGGGLRDPEQLASFVLGTSRMIARDLRRTDRRRGALLDTFGTVLAEAAAPAPLLDVERLRDCLDRLPERDRTVVLATFYAERPAEEIAREMGTSAGNSA